MTSSYTVKPSLAEFKKLASQGNLIPVYAEILADVQAWTHEPTAGELDGFAAQVEAADRTR